MKKLTRQFIDYTNARKSDLEAAKLLEQAAPAVPLDKLSKQGTLVVPRMTSTRTKMANIGYQVTNRRLNLAAKALGNESMSNRQVGLKTFDYFYRAEVGEEA